MDDLQADVVKVGQSRIALRINTGVCCFGPSAAVRRRRRSRHGSTPGPASYKPIDAEQSH
jgi:hypothetical protein